MTTGSLGVAFWRELDGFGDVVRTPVFGLDTTTSDRELLTRFARGELFAFGLERREELADTPDAL